MGGIKLVKVTFKYGIAVDDVSTDPASCGELEVK